MTNVKNTWVKLLLKMPSLFLGFFLYAVAILLALYSKLGMSPWDVFHMGIVNHSMFSLGQMSQIVGFCLIILSIFLGVVPGIGSVLNMIFIGFFVDVINNTGIFKTPETMLSRIFMLIAAIIIMGFATYFYLRVELGAGPRDGLMEGLVRKLNRPVWLIRGTIEVTVLIIGFFWGGPVGVGTLLLALLIGPSVQLAFKIGKYDSKEANHSNLLDLYKGLKVPANIE
ncbi:membrane protein [Desulfosporosinus sp. PR]|uniref:YczE/YyaS/YitT family protein n=1 Tax=Candidatus Desulfosporosinus nitrosoreducens TaxID=3401928 RepID=UPI0027F4FFF0|nr:membrane protein [Desulfosporosinus sp. PR]MDQ7097101.1 membrane protein [Desulfosporosinus sp. PR]